MENFELIFLIMNSNILLFDFKIIKKIEIFENRRERVKYFLEICLNLLKEE